MGETIRTNGRPNFVIGKSDGNSLLTKKELQDVFLDVDVTQNNGPLGYQVEDIQVPTLTPNSWLFVRSTQLLELTHHNKADYDLGKRAKYLKQSKAHMCNRWTKAYFSAFRGKHDSKHNTKPLYIAIGYIVMIYSEERNRRKWPLKIVQELYPGRDGAVWSVLRERYIYYIPLNCRVT